MAALLSVDTTRTRHGSEPLFSNSIRFEFSNLELDRAKFKVSNINRTELKATEPNFEFFLSFLLNVPFFEVFDRLLAFKNRTFPPIF